MLDAKLIKTLIVTPPCLSKHDGKLFVDTTEYHSIIGAL